MILDGELLALDEHGVPSFQALQHRSVKRSAVVFYAFDLVHLRGKDLRAEPLSHRRQALHALNFQSPILLSQPLPGTPGQIEYAVRRFYCAASCDAPSLTKPSADAKNSSSSNRDCSSWRCTYRVGPR